MKKIVFTALVCILLFGCSKNEPEKIKEVEVKIDPQVERLIVSLSQTFSNIKPVTSTVGNQSLVSYAVSKDQKIDIFSDIGKLSHIFVKQSGEKEQAEFELLTTCKIVANNLEDDLSAVLDEMYEKTKKYSSAGVGARTAQQYAQYYLMLDLSRYQVGDCLIATKPINTIVKNFQEPIEPTEMTPQQAHDFGKKLYKQIVEYELFIRDAFELGSLQDFEQFDLEFNAFVQKPYGASEAQLAFGQKYFPDNVVAEPYIICDKALNGLYFLGNGMRLIIKQDSASIRKSLRETEGYFLKAKEDCKSIVDMPYEKAVEVYEDYL